MPYMRYVFLIALILVTAGTGFYTYNLIKGNSTPENGHEVGNIFIDLEVPLITDDIIKISDLKGDLIIIDFMAPWCPPCKEQIKVFQQIKDIEGVSIISVNIDPNYDINTLSEIAKKEDVTWYYGHLPEAALEYKVSAIPVIVVVDQTGIIRYRGFFTPYEVLQQLINKFK
jgi:thiol-disulfide isomerase/thioredoxin